MNCWTLLQLPDDADARSIKRSYARLLKSCRPDEDAEGFQRLREAYEEALDMARWRAEAEADEQDTPVVETAQANPNDYPALIEVQPVTPAAVELPAHLQQTQALFDGLNAHNLDERWQQAQQQGCADPFQAALLRHCFESPGERGAIAAWAVQRLEWLTPWQSVRMTPWQHEALAGELLQEYRRVLQDLLEQKAEREFVNQLGAFNQHAWLRVFDLQQQWQRIVLQLLHDTQWSVPLFERVSQAFGWDEQHGVHPEPEWMWRGLVERCQHESFYAELQAKAADARQKSADALAAKLLLTPMSTTAQSRLVATFGENEWSACQQLAQTLTWRYPQLVERLPAPDVFFWRKFLPRPVSHYSWTRVWGGLAIAGGLAFYQHEKTPMAAEMFIVMLLTFIPAMLVIRGTQLWAALASHLIVPDLWLTRRLLPERFSPHQYWLVLRHGIPQVGMLLMFGFVLGLMGMVTYLGMILLSLFTRRRIGKMNQTLEEKYHWIAGVHWAHWSPWQVLFLLVMVAASIACQQYLPAFPWTDLTASRR